MEEVKAQRGAATRPRSHSEPRMHPDLPPPNPEPSNPYARVRGSRTSRVQTLSSPQPSHTPQTPYLWDPSGHCLRPGSWAERLDRTGISQARLGQGGSATPRRGRPPPGPKLQGCSFHCKVQPPHRSAQACIQEAQLRGTAAGVRDKVRGKGEVREAGRSPSGGHPADRHSSSVHFKASWPERWRGWGGS